jgi:hypothetical protein
MWMVNPELLCRKHLLGEHYELHKLAGSIAKNKNITGYIQNSLVFPSLANERHDELAEEMKRRGYAHNSPLSRFTGENYIVITDKLVKDNMAELACRCEQCRQRIYSLEAVVEA